MYIDWNGREQEDPERDAMREPRKKELNMSYSMQAVNDPSEEGYWWFSVGGMAEMRDRMRAAHVLDDETPQPPRPEGDEAALQAWRRQTSPNPRQIPAWKFESNDGWIVTPEECVLVAESLNSSDCPSTRKSLAAASDFYIALLRIQLP